MKVYYCQKCDKYTYKAVYKNKKCKSCGNTLIILPIDFIKFYKMDLDERNKYLSKYKNT